MCNVRVSVGHVAGFPRLEGGGCKKPLPQLVRRTDHGVVGSQRGWQDDHHDHADRYRHIIKQLNARTHSYIGSIVHVTAWKDGQAYRLHIYVYGKKEHHLHIICASVDYVKGIVLYKSDQVVVVAVAAAAATVAVVVVVVPPIWST